MAGGPRGCSHRSMDRSSNPCESLSVAGYREELYGDMDWPLTPVARRSGVDPSRVVEIAPSSDPSNETRQLSNEIVHTLP